MPVFYDYDMTISTTTATTTTTTYSGVCKITLYDMTHFRGNFKELFGSNSDLSQINFDDEVASVKIQGNCCWKLYIGNSFSKKSLKLGEGEYPSSTDIKLVFKRVSSVKKLNSC